ncbi:dual specificity tyrosine-phosphorylation-regulated kinase [Acrasis kona]|uniref:Dual specificity tyrosine-phosphorylation-regulated kinase n=1 Tax=Acrasis kona TaxID=1008807 RepID=A0AAW2ZE53_9EUKA
MSLSDSIIVHLKEEKGHISVLIEAFDDKNKRMQDENTHTTRSKKIPRDDEYRAEKDKGYIRIPAIVGLDGKSKLQIKIVKFLDIFDEQSDEEEYPDQQKDEEREDSDPEDDTLEGIHYESSSCEEREEKDEERKIKRRIRRRSELINRFANLIEIAEDNNSSSDTDVPEKVEKPVQFDTIYLPIIHQKNKTGFEEHSEFPITVGSIIAGRYQIMEYLGSAAFSRAIQCLDLQTDALVCVKIIKNNKDFFDQSLDEIKLLRYINSHGDPDEHNVVQLYEYFYFKEHLFLVFELLRDNLYDFSQYNRTSESELYFTLPRLQSITMQVVKALRYINSLHLIHCDLKPENVLIKSYSRCLVKVIDFGSSCFTHDHLSSYVQSRTYRAPEVVLGLPYDGKVDIWSLGCILAELYTGNVLFVNNSMQTMLARIIGICGMFDFEMLSKGRFTHKFFTKQYALFEKNKQTGDISFLIPKKTTLKARMNNCPNDNFVDFIQKCLIVNPKKRMSCDEALHHPFLIEPIE